MGWPGDSLWVLESSGYRISLFLPDCTFEDSMIEARVEDFSSGPLGERLTVGQWRNRLAEAHPPPSPGGRAPGGPLGRVLVPEALRRLAADRSWLWGIEQDELEVEYIVRYRIFPERPGS